jgi:hypothetical protein
MLQVHLLLLYYFRTCVGNACVGNFYRLCMRAFFVKLECFQHVKLFSKFILQFGEVHYPRMRIALALTFFLGNALLDLNSYQYLRKFTHVLSGKLVRRSMKFTMF